MHYFPFNIKDYASHTGHLSIIEDLAYRRLLEQYYLSERPLDDCLTALARLIRMKEYEEEIKTVLYEFFTLTDDGWINERALKEISHYQSKIDQASKAGKASAQRRLNGSSTDVQPTNNHKPLTINQEPIIKEPKGSLSEPRVLTCPQQEILKLWSKHLPHLTQPRSWEGNRQAALRQRWIQASKPSNYSPKGYGTVEDGLSWWDSFFGYIANDTTLAKGFETKDRTWRPDLEWIVNATNFQKIIDGKYNK